MRDFTSNRIADSGEMDFAGPREARRGRGARSAKDRCLTAWNGDWPNLNAMARNTTERNSESAAQSFAIRNALAETTDTYSIL